MKTLSIVISTLAAVAVSANAALINVDAGSGVNAFGITDYDGKVFRNGTTYGQDIGSAANPAISAGAGVIGIGIFTTTTDLEKMTAEELSAAFKPFGELGTFSTAGVPGTRSMFLLKNNAPVGGTAFSGNFIYLFVGNGDSFATSTQALIVKSAFTFTNDMDESPTPTAFTIDPTRSEVLFGSVLEIGPRTTNADKTDGPGWRMAMIVPEPSVALLGALGMLGFLRRRR